MVFNTDADREAWLTRKEESCRRSGWRVQAWVLMTNHYHLVLTVTWIAEALQMGDPKRAAKLVQTDPRPDWGEDWKVARTLMRKLEKGT